MMSNFYTYLHLRNDTGKVFYVGKGSGRRAGKTQDRSAHWKRIVAKHGYTIEIAAYWESEAEAFSHECLLISCLREMGVPIVNRTDGGDGMSGHIHTDETKAKIRAAAIGKPKDRSAVEKSRLSNLGRKTTEAAKQKRRETVAGRCFKHSESSLEKMRLARSSPEARARMSVLSKAALSDPEAIKRMLASRLLSKTYGKAFRKPVTCINSGVTYVSIKDAAVSLGVGAGNVSSVCRGKAKSAGGMSFCYAEPNDVPPVAKTNTTTESTA